MLYYIAPILAILYIVCLIIAGRSHNKLALWSSVLQLVLAAVVTVIAFIY